MSVLGALQSTDDPHVDKINTPVRANRRLTIRELAEYGDISIGSCYEILTAKLKMHLVALKFVPLLITDDQKVNRVRVCQELLDRSDEDENLFLRIMSTQNFTAIRCSFMAVHFTIRQTKETHYLKPCSLSTNEDICDRKTAF